MLSPSNVKRGITLIEVAGFEIGTGIYINTALPEETAQFMREFKAE
jgi:galactose-1-phosphate uridylyltransferase